MGASQNGKIKKGWAGNRKRIHPLFIFDSFNQFYHFNHSVERTDVRVHVARCAKDSEFSHAQEEQRA